MGSQQIRLPRTQRSRSVEKTRGEGIGRVVHETPAARVPYPICPKCGGHGKRQKRKNHKPDCACVACKPCGTCGGVGRVKGEPR